MPHAHQFTGGKPGNDEHEATQPASSEEAASVLSWRDDSGRREGEGGGGDAPGRPCTAAHGRALGKASKYQREAEHTSVTVCVCVCETFLPCDVQGGTG